MTIAQRLADAGIEVKPLEWRQVGAMRLAYPYCFDDRGAARPLEAILKETTRD